MKRSILLSALAVSGFMMANGAVITATPGSLEAQLVNIPASDTELEVNGTIDVRDLRAIASRSGITDLNLKGSKIVSYNAGKPDEYGQSFFQDGLIPQYVFFKADLGRVQLPSNTTEIGNGAFANSSVTEVVLPSGLKKIGNHAFYGCVDMTRIYPPTSLTNMGVYVMAKCSSLTSVDLRSTRLSVIPANAFSGCASLGTVTLPSTLRTIGTHAFEGTIIPMLDVTQVMTFDDYALAGMTNLVEVSISPSAKIGDGLLMDDSKIQTVVGAPTSVPNLFAANCKSLYVDDAVQNASNIGDYSFANTGATTLVLSPRLTSLGKGAMANMKGLTKIDARNLGEQIPEVESDTFEGINTPQIDLHVASNTENYWMAHPVWGRFKVTSDTMTVLPVLGDDLGIRIGYRDQILDVTANDVIRNVEVYTVNGSLLLAAEPGDAEFSISLPTEEKVLIIRVTTTKGTETAKLLVR